MSLSHAERFEVPGNTQMAILLQMVSKGVGRLLPLRPV